MLLGGHPDVCTVGELKAAALGRRDALPVLLRRADPPVRLLGGDREEAAARGVPLRHHARAHRRPREVDSAYVAPAAAAAAPGAGCGAAAGRGARAARRPGAASCRRSSGGNAVLARGAAATQTGKSCRRGLLEERHPAQVPAEQPGARREGDPHRPRRPGGGARPTWTRRGFADAERPAAARGAARAATAPTSGCPCRAAAREWRRSNEEAESDRAQAAARRAGPRCATRTSAATRRGRCGACSRSWTWTRTAAGARLPRSFEHHVIGNGMRLDTTSEIRLDERWRTALTPADLAVFEAEAGALNRQLGYA